MTLAQYGELDPYFAWLCVGFPFTIVLIVSAVVWVDRRRGVKWRLRHGRCLTCGSDLRDLPSGPMVGSAGNPTGDRKGYCPRCEPKNLCPVCGYDLRATPDRCPECGAVPHPSEPG